MVLQLGFQRHCRCFRTTLINWQRDVHQVFQFFGGPER